VDHEVRMGIVDDVKQALRRANALNINYSTLTVDDIFRLRQSLIYKKAVPKGQPFFYAVGAPSYPAVIKTKKSQYCGTQFHFGEM
jgi:hypothetical protein